MANLKPIAPIIGKLADRAIKTDTASQLIGYETTATLSYDTSLAGHGSRIAFRHFATDIVSLHVRPQGLATFTAPRLYSLTVDNGGFRTQATTGRIQEILAAFGFGWARRGTRPDLGDCVYAANREWQADYQRQLVVHFDEVGAFSMSYGAGRAYPTAREITALEWLNQGLKDDEEAAISALEDAIQVIADATPARWNGKGNFNPDYLYSSRSVRLREYASFRRFPCATRYGDPATRKALDIVLAYYVEDAGECFRSQIAAIEYGGNTGTRETAPAALARLNRELAAVKESAQ